MRVVFLAALAITWPVSAALHAALHTARRFEPVIHCIESALTRAAKRLERE